MLPEKMTEAETIFFLNATEYTFKVLRENIAESRELFGDQQHSQMLDMEG